MMNAGCALTRGTYDRLVHPDRLHQFSDLVGCSVAERDGRMRVSVLLRLEDGPMWRADEETIASALATAQGQGPGRHTKLAGRIVRSSALPVATMPCVALMSPTPVAGAPVLRESDIPEREPVLDMVRR